MMRPPELQPGDEIRVYLPGSGALGGVIHSLSEIEGSSYGMVVPAAIVRVTWFSGTPEGKPYEGVPYVLAKLEGRHWQFVENIDTPRGTPERI